MKTKQFSKQKWYCQFRKKKKTDFDNKLKNDTSDKDHLDKLSQKNIKQYQQND